MSWAAAPAQWRMRSIGAWLALALAACTQAPAPPPSSGSALPLPQLESDGAIEWQGVLPCADCDGIETRLLLERVGDSRPFTLTETFLAADGDVRFVESGQWRREGALIRLQGQAVPRVYVLLQDLHLAPGDSRGQPVGRDDGQTLAPIGTQTVP